MLKGQHRLLTEDSDFYYLHYVTEWGSNRATYDIKVKKVHPVTGDVFPKYLLTEEQPMFVNPVVVQWLEHQESCSKRKSLARADKETWNVYVREQEKTKERYWVVLIDYLDPYPLLNEHTPPLPLPLVDEETRKRFNVFGDPDLTVLPNGEIKTSHKYGLRDKVKFKWDGKKVIGQIVNVRDTLSYFIRTEEPHGTTTYLWLDDEDGLD